MFEFRSLGLIYPDIFYSFEAVAERRAPTRPLDLRKLRGGVIPAVDQTAGQAVCPGMESGHPPVFADTLPPP